MVVNVGDTSPESTIEQQDTGNEGFVMQAIEGIRAHAKTGLLALGIGAAAIPAMAQEDVRLAQANIIPVAMANGVTIEGVNVREESSDWLNQLDLTNPRIRNFLAPRVTDESFDYMRPYLIEFTQLSPEKQDFIASADMGIEGFTSESWKVVNTLSRADMELLSNLRVPPEVVEYIKASLSLETAPETASSQLDSLYEATPEGLMEKHAEAIVYGRQEFIGNMKLDPELEGLEDADYRDYGNELLDAFLSGKDDGTLGEFVKYAPAFTGYVLAFPGDFTLSPELQQEYDIAEQNSIQAEQNSIQAEQNSIQAEQNSIQAELQKNIDALQRLRDQLADIIGTNT